MNTNVEYVYHLNLIYYHILNHCTLNLNKLDRCIMHTLHTLLIYRNLYTIIKEECNLTLISYQVFFSKFISWKSFSQNEIKLFIYNSHRTLKLYVDCP